MGNRSVRMFQGNNVIMSQGSSVEMFQNSNAKMYRASLVEMCLNKNAKMYQDNNARMSQDNNAQVYQDKNVNKCASQFIGAKYATKLNSILFFLCNYENIFSLLNIK